MPITWEKFKYHNLYKDSTRYVLRDEKEILSRWREHFEDLLNQARATPTDTCDTIDFGKEEVFTLTEVAAAIRGLKSGKAASEDEIRPKMLKTLNGGVRWFDEGVSGGVKTWKNTKRLADMYDHSYIQERRS